MAAADWRRDLDLAVPPGVAPGVRHLVRIVADEQRRLRAAYAPPSVALGAAVSGQLTPDGAVTPQLVAGWHYPEPHGTWSARRRARVVLTLDRPRSGPLLLVADLVPFLSPARPRMEIRVRLDGRVATTWVLEGTELALYRRRVRIPARPARTRLDVVLDVRDPLTGYDNGTYGDERALGVTMRTLFVRRPHRR